jgi:hypothetical protein
MFRQSPNINGMDTTISLHRIKLDRLSRFKGLVTFHLNGGEMGEEVFFMFIADDKPNAFRIVAPLNLPYGHNGLLTTTLINNLKPSLPLNGAESISTGDGKLGSEVQPVDGAVDLLCQFRP